MREKVPIFQGWPDQRKGAVNGRNKDRLAVRELKLDPGDLTVGVKVRSRFNCQLRSGGNEDTATFAGVRRSVSTLDCHVEGGREYLSRQYVRGQPCLCANDDVRGIGGNKVVEGGCLVSNAAEVDVKEAECVGFFTRDGRVCWRGGKVECGKGEGCWSGAWG